MPQFTWPLLFTVFVWWFATGVILYLDGLPRRTFKWTMAGASVLCVAALAGLNASAAHTTPAAAYCAMSCALLVWAWQEVAFLLGYVTGPHRAPCPPGLRGWPRTRLAVAAVAHHELALVVLAGAVLAATWEQPNQTGWWTYVILWAMRQSAKLNVFLGVRNLSESFLPEHLKYLQSYFARKPMNALLPVSVLCAAAVAWPLWQAAGQTVTPATAYAVTSATLLAVLLSLAIVEHVFLVMPLPLEGLWQWGMGSHQRGRAAAEGAAAQVGTGGGPAFAHEPEAKGVSR